MPAECTNSFALVGRIAGRARRLVTGISVPVVVYRPENLPARPDRDGRPMEFDFLYVIIQPGSIDQQTAALLRTKQAKGRVVHVEGYLQQRDLDQPVWYALQQALPRGAYEALHTTVVKEHPELATPVTAANIHRTVVELAATQFSMEPKPPTRVRLHPATETAVPHGGDNHDGLVAAIVADPQEEEQ
jgi:hypothetical protein